MKYGAPSTAVAPTFTGRCVQLPLFCTAPTRTQFFNREVRTQLTTHLITPDTRISFRSLKKLRKRQIRCSLTRLTGDASHKVLPALATGDQWAHFWGGTEIQRVGKAFEVVAIAFLGLWACYFTSFFLGVGAMSIIGGSFLFYWLLAPNMAAYRRNRVLRGRIAPSPGAKGNHMAIFSARVVSATEEYHPITGQPVFLRMIVEDEDGRALKFRTRTRAEYARVRPGMVTEAVLVSPDEYFEEIIGVSDTFVPGANVWVGEYPYLDKVVMRRLIASRDARLRRGRTSGGVRESELDDELDPMPYREDWTERDGMNAFTARERSPHSVGDLGSIDTLDQSFLDEDDEGEPQYEANGSTEISREDLYAGGGVISAGRRRWERGTGQPRPRRRRPPMSIEFEGGNDAYPDRRMREKRFNREDGTSSGGGPFARDSRKTARREQGAK